MQNKTKVMIYFQDILLRKMSDSKVDRSYKNPQVPRTQLGKLLAEDQSSSSVAEEQVYEGNA